MLWVIVALLVGSAGLVVLSLLPREWKEAPPEPPKPLAAELIEPRRTILSRPTRGMSIGPDGFGTIVSAPARQLEEVSPSVPGGPPVAPQVGGLVRLLARLAPMPPSDRLMNFNAEEPSPQFGTIILRNGCLKLAERGEPHVVLPAGTTLDVDDEGFLMASLPGNNAGTNLRLGEPAWWPGRTPIAIDAAAVSRIQAKCGPGAVRIVGEAQSVSASQAAADGAAARRLVDMYGVRWAAAIVQVRACRTRLAQNSGIDPLKMIQNPCGSTPPSPVADPRSCPTGTSFAGGLCRTPEGHIRPIPAL